MDKKIDAIVQCDKLINKFLLRAKRFVDYACFQYGACQTALSGAVSPAYVDDFQYFVFVKSTKSLCAIRELLKRGLVEDVFILLRTMFEGYLASRFIAEKEDDGILDDFIFVPQQIARRKIIYQEGVAKKRDTGEIVNYTQWNPSQMKLGKDKGYFVDFYAYLCNYAHCNFSILHCYLNDRNAFSIEEKTNEYMVRILVIFVYTKIFENIVTVEGEDFLDKKEEIKCYNLVRESIMFLDKRLEQFSKYDCKMVSDEENKHMKDMFKSMRKSLKEEIGSLEKDFLNNSVISNHKI